MGVYGGFAMAFGYLQTPQKETSLQRLWLIAAKFAAALLLTKFVTALSPTNHARKGGKKLHTTCLQPCFFFFFERN